MLQVENFILVIMEEIPCLGNSDGQISTYNKLNGYQSLKIRGFSMDRYQNQIRKSF